MFVCQKSHCFWQGHGVKQPLLLFNTPLPRVTSGRPWRQTVSTMLLSPNTPLGTSVCMVPAWKTKSHQGLPVPYGCSAEWTWMVQILESSFFHYKMKAWIICSPNFFCLLALRKYRCWAQGCHFPRHEWFWWWGNMTGECDSPACLFSFSFLLSFFLFFKLNMRALLLGFLTLLFVKQKYA